MTQVTFTTEFLEYYEALAMASHAALVAGIKKVIPGAAPTAAELYGPNFNPTTAAPEARAQAFRGNATNNPWNDGRKGILCLAQQFNTLSALFNLGGRAAIPKPNVPAGAVCATLGDFCGPARNSDPSIAAAVQTLARASRGLSFADPVGIVIDTLGGIWRIGKTQIDVNDPAANQGAWTITRGGRRAVLKIVPGLLLDDVQDRERGAGGVGAERHRSARCRPPRPICRRGRGWGRSSRSGWTRSPTPERWYETGPRLALLGLCILLGGAVTHGQLRKQARDGAPIKALTAAERAALGDPLFKLVLQASPTETTLDGIERRLMGTDGMRRLFVVHEEGLDPTPGRFLRAVLTYRGTTQNQQLQPNVALSVSFDHQGLSTDGLEAWGWDDARSRYNYYRLDRQPGEAGLTWKFRGSSVGADALSNNGARRHLHALPHQRGTGDEGAAAAVEQLALVQVAPRLSRWPGHG